MSIAKQYETDLTSEVKNALSISDILAINVSKNIDNKNFTNQISGIIRNIISKNPKIYNISLITNEVVKTTDSLLIEKSLTDSIYYYKISISRKKSGISSDKKNIPINDIENQLLVSKSIEKNISNVLNIEFINDNLSILPIIQPIYKGNRYIGYIRYFLDVNWLYQKKYNYYKISQKDIDIDIASKNGKIFFSNKHKYLIGKDLKSEHSECDVITNSKSLTNKTTNELKSITLCKAIDINNNKWSIRLSIDKFVMYKILGYNFYINLLLGSILLVIVIIVIAFFLKKTIQPLKNLIVFARNISVGNFEYNENIKQIKTQNELKQLQESIEAISKSFSDINQLSKSITSGDFSKIMEVRSPEDELAKSINKMNQFLLEEKEYDKQRKIINEHSKWFTDGLNEINKVLKIHHQDIYILTERVTQAIVKFFNIAFGGIFITTKNEADETILELISAYAYSESKFVKKTFKIGESLIGACASEKRIVSLKKLPEGYLQVLSGLGKTAPKHLLILPLLYENELMGVLELASLNTISDKEIKLIENIAENIASNLSIAKANLHTQKLLDKSQQYTKKLAEKDEKMNIAMVKLKDLQEITAKSETSVKAKLNAMNNTLMTVEYTIDGILLDANKKYLSTMNYSFDEIKGINVLELLKNEDREELIKVIEIVKKGNFYEAIMRRPTKEGREKWILATYTPIIDENNNVEKILFYGVDITRIKEKENNTIFNNVND